MIKQPRRLTESILLRNHPKRLSVYKNTKKEAKFDADNGQMYMESTMRAIRQEDRLWTDLSELQQAQFAVKVAQDAKSQARLRENRGQAAAYVVYMSKQGDPWPAKGSRKLVDMMVTAAVENGMNEDYVIILEERLPARILMQLWREMCRR